ncbi:competence protein ComEC [Gracilibacillus orientalis]|uniref:Competence protein ComEC n=1 Tax=Gracilibacillus orientalis TaxID=334253 RepID=A0A1I4KQ73_9BACI|nr:DNA internalization-related competence protein ComEC/Rec2 [Gracilibacillus orientalis]SFL80904.1 competence protein ComEC [Gracilibacillus orientalis]
MYQRLHWFVLLYVISFVLKDVSGKWFVVILGIITFYLIYFHRFSKLLITSLIVFGLFSFYQIPSLHPNDTIETSSSVSIQGKIQSSVEKNSQFFRFTFQSSDHQLIQVYYFTEPEEYRNKFMSFRTGASCTLYGTFQSIPAARNPGQFDYKDYLASQGIEKQLVIESMEQSKCEGQSSWQKIYDVRQHVLDHIEHNVSAFTYAWFAALLFGDRGHLEDDVTTLFQNWNLTHLLAISGLHVGLILSIVYFLMLFLSRITIEKAQVLIACLLFLYPAMAGGAPSVWRASLLAIVIIVLSKLPIRLATTDMLSIVFLIMVILDKFVIYSIAFQFSFIVTFGIILSRKLLNDDVGYIWLVLRISLISMLIILPIQLYHFFQFQPLSVFLNVIVIPYFTFIVLPYLILILFASLMPPVLAILDSIFVDLHTAVITALTTIDHFIQPPWLTGEFPIYFFLPFYILLWLFLYYFEKKQLSKALQFGSLIVLLLTFICIRPYLDPHGYITMLDIGQGDAIIVELPYRKGVFIFDAGGKMTADFSETSSETFDQVIDPYLKSKGINKIDAIILSHADHDHVGSVPYILAGYSVDYVITSPYFDAEIIEQYKNTDTESQFFTVKAGDTFDLKQHTFEVHYPERNQTDNNGNSLVISSTFGKDKWLFTGDLGETGETEIVHAYPALKADVLKVAHHGSNTSSSPSFLAAVEADLALISVGENNHYGHPHKDVLDNLKRYNVKVMRTDQYGAIIYKFSEERGTVFPYLP